MPDDIGVAIIGLGTWGDRLAEATAGVPGLHTAACFSRSPAARDEFAAKHSCRPAPRLEAALENPDVAAVMIATPHSTHEQIAVAAAEAGKHVFVEKPLTLTTAAAKQIIAACDRAGVVLQVGHNRRRQSGVRWIKSVIESGDLGRVAQLETNLSRPGGLGLDPTHWRADPTERPAGAMTALGVHIVDTMHYLLGPVTRVSAYSKGILDASPLDEVTAILLEFASGPLGYLGSSYVVPATSRVAAFGVEGTAWVEAEGAECYLQRKGDPERQDVAVEPIDTVADEVAEFRDSILGKATPDTGGPEGLEVVAVLQAVLASIERGSSVEVDEFR